MVVQVGIDGLERVMRRSREYVDSKVEVGKDVYVGVDGDDVLGDGSEERPFASLQRAADELDKGARKWSTIYLLPGEYNYVLERTSAFESDEKYLVEARGFDGFVIQSRDGKGSVVVNVIGTSDDTASTSIFRFAHGFFSLRELDVRFKSPVSSRQMMIYGTEGSVITLQGVDISVLTYGNGNTAGVDFIYMKRASSLLIESQCTFSYAAKTNGRGIIVDNSTAYLRKFSVKGENGPSTGNYVFRGGQIYIDDGSSWKAYSNEDLQDGSGFIRRVGQS